MERIELMERGLAALATGPRGGRPIVFLHGFPDIPRGYAPLMESFAGLGSYAVAPYQRGYAPSATEGITSLDVLAKDLLAWMERLSPHAPMHVVGHDWGAVVAQRAAMWRPDRFAALGLLAVPHLLAFAEGVLRHPAQLHRSRYMLHFQAGALADGLARAGGYRYIKNLWRRWSPSLTPEPSYLRELFECFDASWPAPLRYYRVARKPGVWPSSMILAPDHARDAIRVPTLYLHGAEDGCVGAEIIDGQEHLFGAVFQACVLLGAGHFLHIEAPDEVFTLLRGFFEARSG